MATTLTNSGRSVNESQALNEREEETAIPARSQTVAMANRRWAHLLVLSLRGVAAEWWFIQMALSYRPEWEESCAMKKTMTARERVQWANSNDAHYAALSGKPAKYQQELPKERAAIVHSDPGELEGAVMKEVAHILAVHPNVQFAMRVNSGMAWMPSKGNKEAPVWFYRIIKQPFKTRIVDYVGFTMDMKPIALECKRRDWKYNPQVTREAEQHNYILMVQSRGGVGGFVTSGEQALAILNQA